MKSRIILFFLALLVANIHASTSDCTPSQIHLSLGDSYYSASGPINPELNPSQVNNNQAYLVWQTPATPCQYVVIVNDVQTQQEVFNATNVSPQPISLAVTAEDGTVATTSLDSYTVLLTNLSYGTNYSYSILDQNNASLAGPFQFNLVSPNLTSSSNKIIVVGDLDLLQNDSMTLEAINELLEGDEAYAGMIQIGQVPYYLQNGTSDIQNEFNSTLANFTATLPLIMAPGRGETSSNSSFLNFRIRNPLFDATKNQYFSFNLQGIHFVSINLDYYNLTTTNQSQVESWLENDLKSANSTASRETWPFIIVVTSYPLYCTSSENAPETADCATFFAQNEKLDDLFTNSNVDLVISGGMNAYQQLLPTDDSTTQASQDSTLTNSNSTVYVIEGVGSSSQSGVHPGFGVVYAQSNSTGSTLFYEHYDSDTGDKVNSLTLVKTAQGSTPTPTPNDNGQNSGDNTPTPTPTPSDNTPNTGDNTNTNTNTPDNTPTPGDNTNTNTNTTDNTPTPGDNTNTNTNTNTTDNNQNSNNGKVTPTDDGELEGPTENPNASDPEGSESIVPRLIIPFVIIIAIVLVAIYWKRRRTDPEMESLTTKEYKSNKIYNKRSTDASISMVDLVL